MKLIQNHPTFSSNKVQLNEFISLRLENGRTNIFLKDQLFRQCKSLVFQISSENFEEYDNLKSIDELRLENHISQKAQLNITPEEEFRGHCSNLQCWVEYGYDTRILNYNLSFPLLKELVRLGDTRAKDIFKEEIFSRFDEGSVAVKIFLLEEGYLNNFTPEVRSLVNDGLDQVYTTSYFANKHYPEIPNIFDSEELHSSTDVRIRSKRFSNSYNRTFDSFQPISDITHIPGLKSLTDITELSLIDNSIIEIKGLDKFTYLRELALNSNFIREIVNLDSLKKLRSLNLSGNIINRVQGLENLTELEFLNLSHNKITKMEGFNHLKKLKILSLWGNQIEKIENLDHLVDLRKLVLGENNISKIEGLDKLKNLRILILDNNNISQISGLDNLSRLTEASFYGNKISEINEIDKLKGLQEVNLRKNLFTTMDIQKFKGYIRQKGITSNFYF